MSMSRGCELIELKPGEWYCVVATHEYDYDFSRGHNVYGPRSTEDDAWKAMSNRECNPGQSITIPHERVTERERRLVDDGFRAGDRAERSWGGYGNLGW